MVSVGDLNQSQPKLTTLQATATTPKTGTRCPVNLGLVRPDHLTWQRFPQVKKGLDQLNLVGVSKPVLTNQTLDQLGVL